MKFELKTLNIKKNSSKTSPKSCHNKYCHLHAIVVIDVTFTDHIEL